MVRRLNLVLAGLLLALGLTLALPRAAAPQTPDFATTVPGVVVLPFHISGQYTATTAAVVRFNMPFRSRLVSVQASARASGGTAPTLTVDVLEAGVTVLSAPVAVTAGAVAFATLSDTVIADEAAVTVTLTIGGTSPTWNDIVVILTVARI
jgi:hypothetical protein